MKKKRVGAIAGVDKTVTQQIYDFEASAIAGIAKIKQVYQGFSPSDMPAFFIS